MVYQLGRECRQPLDLIFCLTIFDRNVATFDIAGIAQTTSEVGQA
jgi:hypothetical protein